MDTDGAVGPHFEEMAHTQKGHTNERTRYNAKFDDFAEQQGNQHPLDDYTVESVEVGDEEGKLLLEKTFGAYATFVKQLMFKKKNGDESNYAPDTMLKYFSTPYNTLQIKFKELPIFRLNDLMNGWWVKLYCVEPGPHDTVR